MKFYSCFLDCAIGYCRPGGVGFVVWRRGYGITRHNDIIICTLCGVWIRLEICSLLLLRIILCMAKGCD